MSETKTSIDAYVDLGDAISSQKSALTLEDLKRLLDLMKEELLVSGGSPLISAAYKSCCSPFRIRKTFSPTCFSLSVDSTAKRTDIPNFDAWWLIILLSQYLSNGSIAEESDQHLSSFFKKGLKYKNASKDDLVQALMNIDARIPKHRREMYVAFSSDNAAPSVGKDGRSIVSVKTVGQKSVLSESRKETDNRPDEATKKDDQGSVVINQADEQARKILEDAQKKADEQARKILEDARKKADEQSRKILEDAQKKADEQADKKISEAQKRFADMVIDCKSKAFDKEADGVQKHFLDVREALQGANEKIKKLEDSFSNVREALQGANEKIRKLEDSFSETITKKVSDQLLELFNLIADTKDSTFDLARKNNDNDLENAAYNMDEFLGMIIEYMADFGIMPIATAPNSRFLVKCHTAVNANTQFDPRTAVIKVSKRSGFLWGDQVLQKEQVEI